MYVGTVVLIMSKLEKEIKKYDTSTQSCTVNND